MLVRNYASIVLIVNLQDFVHIKSYVDYSSFSLKAMDPNQRIIEYLFLCYMMIAV